MIRAAATDGIAPSVDDDRIAYTVEEVGRLVGLNPETIARYVRRGEIPASKLGRAVRIIRADLIRWLESKRLVNTNGPAHHRQAAVACKGVATPSYPQAGVQPNDAVGGRQGESGGPAAKGGGAW